MHCYYQTNYCYCHKTILIHRVASVINTFIIVINVLIIFINKSIFVTYQNFSKPIFHPWRFTTAARTTQLQIVGKDPLHLFIRTVVVRSHHIILPWLCALYSIILWFYPSYSRPTHLWSSNIWAEPKLSTWRDPQPHLWIRCRESSSLTMWRLKSLFLVIY